MVSVEKAAKPADIHEEMDQWSGLNLRSGKTIKHTTWVSFLIWYTVFNAECMGILRGGVLNYGEWL